MSEGRN